MRMQITQNTPLDRAAGMEVALPEVEEALVSTFKPISPRPDFVMDLRNRLQNPPVSQRPKHSNLVFMIIIGSGVATSCRYCCWDDLVSYRVGRSRKRAQAPRPPEIKSFDRLKYSIAVG